MKVYSYDVSQEERIRKHAENVAVNGERILMAKMETIEKTSNARFDHINDKLDNYLGGKRG